MSSGDMVDPKTAPAIRTLVTAGFSVTNSYRLPTHIEIQCERPDSFGAVVRYVIAICEGDHPPAKDLQNIRKQAGIEGRVLVLVAKMPGASWLSWQEFLDSLGGAVPSWRALGAQYEDVLLTSAANQVPSGFAGEAWQIFEDVIADGFEFLFGNRVNRLGGKRRGRRVSDMVTQTPDHHVLVLDGKASKNPYDATWPELRPLVEYTKTQITRQRGQFSVRAAIIVAQEYVQPPSALAKLSGDFLANVGVPSSFLRAAEIAYLVGALAKEPELRSSISWPQVFCRGGLVQRSEIDAEIGSARIGRYPRGTPVSV